jgi:cytochrome c biogenesis protein CcmG/thiol:disulfide interchange protein DsbE
MDEPGRPRRRRVLVLLILVALVAGYLGVTAWIRAKVDALIQQGVGKPLPAFRLVDRDGKEWSAEALRGRPVVLHFFRSWCHGCEAEAPEFRQLEGGLDPQQVTLLHVMTDAVLEFDPAVTQATIAGKTFRRPILMADRAFMDAFHSVQWSKVTPITYVVDATGVIRYGLRGPQTAASVQQALAAAR